MRAPSLTDFTVTVDGIGDFTFGRRTLGDALKIRGEYLRLCKGFGETDNEISAYANVIATLKTLCVVAPAGWEEVEALDLTSDDNTLNKLMELFDQLRGAEDSFRQARGGTSKT